MRGAVSAAGGIRWLGAAAAAAAAPGAIDVTRPLMPRSKAAAMAGFKRNLAERYLNIKDKWLREKQK